MKIALWSTIAVAATTIAAVSVLTLPDHPAKDAASNPPLSSRVTQTPTPDHGEVKDPSGYPALCTQIPESLWDDCRATFNLTDRDIPGPDLAQECIDSYPPQTAKLELGICLEPSPAPR